MEIIIKLNDGTFIIGTLEMNITAISVQFDKHYEFIDFGFTRIKRELIEFYIIEDRIIKW